MRVLKLTTLAAAMMILTVYSVAAQNPNPKRANIWYFGMNAGLDFTNGNPVALTDGALQASEGVTVASDVNGNLQFYTNGGDIPNTGAIWNRNHQVMPNGYLGHTGCASAIQSSIAVNLPGNPGIYYLFTTDCYENSFENGASYSVIDMNLDGGLGDVVEKGSSLIRNTTESIAAVAHANSKDYWIVAHKVNSDSFYVYHFTREGITGVVKSKVGPIVDASAGEIKVSTNGQRLVLAGNHTFTGLFDFDAATGQVSNYRNLGVPNGFTACFSPSCNLLYVASFTGQKIYQFDMLDYNIPASKTLVGSPSSYIGSLQLGPDDRMYIATRNSQYLGVISRPNIEGVDCGYVENGLYLGGKISKYGLPNFPTDVVGECVPYAEENVNQYQFIIRTENIGQSTVAINMNDYPGATEYRVDYKAEGTEWQTVHSKSNVKNIEGLNPDTEYEIRMNSILFANGAEYEFLHNHRFNDITSQEATASATSTKVKTLGEFMFNLYPVPAKETVTVELNFEQATPVEVTVTDLSGKTVYNRTIANAEGFQKLTIPTSELSNGSYHLSVRSNGRNENKKLIVMNY